MICIDVYIYEIIIRIKYDMMGTLLYYSSSSGATFRSYMFALIHTTLRSVEHASAGGTGESSTASILRIYESSLLSPRWI